MSSELLDPLSIRMASPSKTNNGQRLTDFQQLELSAHIRRLNYEPVRDYMVREGICLATDSPEKVLGIMHQVRLKLLLATDAEKVESETYLRQHGYPVPK